jgi:glycosyltransferase involved in cell wall biosynthesis
MKISVITATYNSAETLADCLDSLRMQTHPDIEHVVIDGASSDGTLALLEARRQDVSVLVSEPDGGIYDALNKGIRLSTGHAVGFLHSDDFYATSDALACVADAFADPRIDAVYGDLEYVSKRQANRVIRRWKAGVCRRHDLALGWMPPHPTLFVRRELYARIGGFDTGFPIAADYHSVLRLFSMPGFKAIYLPKVLVKMRMGGASNRSLANVLSKSRQDLAALRQTGSGGMFSLLAKNLRKLPQFFLSG